MGGFHFQNAEPPFVRPLHHRRNSDPFFLRVEAACVTLVSALMRFSSYSYLVWLITPIVQTAILVIMAKKRLFRTFPIFAIYTGFVVLHQITAYVVHRWSDLWYFYAAWIGEIISIVLGFCVIAELFDDLLKHYKSIHTIASYLFRWAIFIAVFLAVLAGVASPGNDVYQFTIGLLTLERSVRIVQFALVMFIMGFAKTLGLTWRHHTYGLAFGFGLFAMVSLIAYVVRIELGPVAGNSVRQLVPTAYLLAATVWLGYLLAPQRLPKIAELPDSNLYRWNLAVGQLIEK
jgi:hypothetical protein